MKHTKHIYWVPFLILSVALFTLTGCGGGSRELGPTVYITGKISLDGKPVTKGTVHFENNQRGTAGSGPIKEDGTYSLELKNTESGESYTVHIGGVTAKEGEFNVDGHAKGDEPPDVPVKYQQPGTSGLTAKLTDASDQSFDFKLTGAQEEPAG